jgi:hypothetical protein
VTVGFFFDDELEYMDMSPVRKGVVKRPEEGRRSSYSNFGGDKGTMSACPIPIDGVLLPPGYRA